MKTINRAIIVLVSMLVTLLATTNSFGQSSPKLPDGGHLLTLEQQQQFEQEAQTVLPGLVSEAKHVNSMKSQGAPINYSGVPNYGVVEADTNAVGWTFMTIGVFTLTQDAPAGSTLIPFITNSGGATAYLRGVSLDNGAFAGWVFQIEPGRLVGDTDWTGKVTFGMLTFGPQGASVAIGETVLKNGYIPDPPQMFLSAPREKGNFLLIRSDRMGKATAVLREQNGYNRYAVMVTRSPAVLTDIQVALPDGLTAGNYILTVNVDGVSDTLGVRLTRIGSTTPGGVGALNDVMDNGVGRTILIRPAGIVVRGTATGIEEEKDKEGKKKPSVDQPPQQ